MIFYLKDIYRLYRKCSNSGSNFLISLFKRLFYLLKGKNISIHQLVTIKGLKNIECLGPLDIGLTYVGFATKYDRTFLNIQGGITFQGTYAIGLGCRFDIGPRAVVSIGEGGYINNNCLFVIMHGLSIGNNTIISWNCQFLDEDFHYIEYEGKKTVDPKIIIGNNVWIGANVKIYKGVRIPDNSIIASDSVVKGTFTEPNTLISGFPAKVIKKGVYWK